MKVRTVYSVSRLALAEVRSAKWHARPARRNWWAPQLLGPGFGGFGASFAMTTKSRSVSLRRVAGGERLQHVGREVLRCEQHSRVRGEPRLRRAVVGDDDGGTNLGDVEEEPREGLRETHAAVAGRVTRKMPRMHGDAGPGEPLH